MSGKDKTNSAENVKIAEQYLNGEISIRQAGTTLEGTAL